MMDRGYLCLLMKHLRTGEEWTSERGGLCFVFTKGGAGACVCGSETRSLAPGDVLVLGPANPGKFSPRPGNGDFMFEVFASDLEHLFPLFATEEMCLVKRVMNNFNPSKLYRAGSAVAEKCARLIVEAPPQFDLEHRGQLLKIVATIFRDEFRAGGDPGAMSLRSDERMKQTLEALPPADLLTLRVTELARRFNCSQRQLNRLFHGRFGVSVAAMRMEMRLLKATALLRNPGVKVIDVAEQCGFNHLGLFYTCFKHRFGTSPGEWRQKSHQLVSAGGESPAGDGGCRMRRSGLCPWARKPGEFVPGRELPSPRGRASGAAKAGTGVGRKECEENSHPLSFRRSHPARVQGARDSGRRDGGAGENRG